MGNPTVSAMVLFCSRAQVGPGVLPVLADAGAPEMTPLPVSVSEYRGSTIKIKSYHSLRLLLTVNLCLATEPQPQPLGWVRHSSQGIVVGRSSSARNLRAVAPMSAHARVSHTFIADSLLQWPSFQPQ